MGPVSGDVAQASEQGIEKGKWEKEWKERKGDVETSGERRTKERGME